MNIKHKETKCELMCLIKLSIKIKLLYKYFTCFQLVNIDLIYIYT